MKKAVPVLILLIAAVIFPAFSGGPEYMMIPRNWPKPHYDLSKNTLTERKILLGRALFYDPLLSENNTISCASCHSPYTAFTHTDHKVSHGIYDRTGTRNAPALQNLAWQTTFMWDGAVHHLDAQAIAPIHNTLEMNETLPNVVVKLQKSALYRGAYYRAFGDSLVTGVHTLKALSQFMLTLVSCNAKYDRVTRHEGNEAFTYSEAHGYKLFKANCASCHKEPLFTNDKFENNGLEPDTLYNDTGRMKVTLSPKDSLKFKVPSLRNVAVTYPYMHDGRFANLQMVLFHYTNGIHQGKTLAKQLRKPIILSENDKRDLVNFLETLTDEEFLRDKQHTYPRAFFMGE